MTPEKWTNTVGNIKDKFKVTDEGSAHEDDEGGIDIQFIVFEGPLGKMRLEYIIKPVIIDRKTTYSKRIGSETDIKYVYSDEEKSNMLIVYKWDDDRDDWVEVDGKMFDA